MERIKNKRTTNIDNIAFIECLMFISRKVATATNENVNFKIQF